MKKLLRILLAAMLLCGFACIVAGAVTPEEEARALLAQTMTDLRGDYTMVVVNKNFFGANETKLCHIDDMTAVIAENTGLEKLLWGKRIYRVYDQDGAVEIYPDRNFYVRLPHGFGYGELLAPKAITADTPMQAQRDGNMLAVHIGVTVEGYYSYGYVYEDGALCEIYGPSDWLRIVSFSKEADQSIFSTQGMWEFPSRLWQIPTWIRLFPRIF